jgi:hypothetical protein
VKVGRSNPQGPGQQEQRGVLGAKISPAVASRDLVPPASMPGPCRQA